MLATVAAAASVAGCATIVYEADLIERVVAMNRVAPEGSYEVVGRLVLDDRVIFLVGDAVTVREPRLADEILEALARHGGDAVIDLRIEEENDPLDVLVNWAQAALNAGQILAFDGPPAVGFLFLGGGNLVGTRSVRITGDVIRWRAGRDGEAARGALAQRCGAADPARRLPCILNRAPGNTGRE